MINWTPEDKYKDRYWEYKRWLRKHKYEQVYDCLKSILQEFPHDTRLTDEMVSLCFNHWGRPDVARPWLVRLTKHRFFWNDHLLLSHLEARLENIPKAKKHLKKAKRLARQQGITDNKRVKGAFLAAHNLIKQKEPRLFSKRQEGITAARPKRKAEISRLRGGSKTSPASTPLPAAKAKAKPGHKVEPPKKIPPLSTTYHIPVKFALPTKEVLGKFLSAPVSNLREARLLIDYTRLTILGGFDELLCLNVIGGVNKYWYQIETVKRALKYFHGRVLLCDEVGLGKTIEAGMLIKEYLMRGMAKNVLILTPPPLVSQWQEEMQVKFGIEFLTTDDTDFTNDPENFWKQRFIIASIHTAKSRNNMPLVINKFYDIVIVDEAHHLRNRTTLAWKLVNQLKKRFIFLLTATPG